MNQLILVFAILMLINCNSKQQNSNIANHKEPLPVKDSLLLALKSTHRISSNHYADMVMDKAGNCYIACFFMKENQKDYILIQKVNPNGKIEWELGTESEGRATAIAINDKDQVFVTGYFINELSLANKKIKTIGDKMFIAEISANGICQNILTNEGAAIPFDIAISEEGAILVGGSMEKRLAFGTQFFETNESQHTGFLALFDSKQKCTWVKPFKGNITRIRANQNNFYVTGGFNELLQFDKDSLITTHRYDYDGFLLAINTIDNNSWLKKFGAEGILKEGYRTNERGADLVFDGEGNVLLAALSNQAKVFERADLVMLKFSTEGKLISETMLVEAINPSGIITLSRDNHNHYWLTGSAYASIKLKEEEMPLDISPSSFILELDANLVLKKAIIPSLQTNMMLRSSSNNNKSIAFTGHFQESLSIGIDTLKTNATHELFFYSLKLAE